MVNSDSSDAELEQAPQNEEPESDSEYDHAAQAYFETGFIPESMSEALTEAFGTPKVSDVYCCCFDCGVEGTYNEVNSHENVCSLRHYNMENVGKWNSFVNLMGIRNAEQIYAMNMYRTEKSNA